MADTDVEQLVKDVEKIKETLYLREDPPALVTQVATLSLNHEHLESSIKSLEESMTSLEQKIDKLSQKITATSVQTTMIVGAISLIVPIILKFAFPG